MQKRLVLGAGLCIFAAMTVQYRIFLYLAGFFLLANLLIMNDVTSLWDGAEALLAWRALNQVPGHAPQELLQAAIIGADGIPHFRMRLPGALLLIFSFVVFWLAGRKLFGREVVLNTLLLLGASLLAPNLAKVAAGDIWAMLSQWLAFVIMLRFLKQPVLLWRLAFYFFLLLAIWVQPINALIFLLGSGAFLYFLHPQGKRLRGLNPWLAALAFFLPLYYSGLTTFSQEGFLFGFRSGRFLLGNLIGILPFLGFVLAGLRETAQRLRRREEMALVNAAGILFALPGHSLALQGILAFLAARQLRSYFDPRYPYAPIVKTGALLHLVAAFCVLTMLMMAGFFQFQGAGFRAMLAAGGIYWMCSFIAVIGLFGPNRRYLLGGMSLGGLLLTMLFWLQANPLLESRRGWVRTLAQQSREMAGAEKDIRAFLLQEAGQPFSALAPYTRAVYAQTALLDNPAQLKKTWADEKQGVFLLKCSEAGSLGALTTPYSVEGWENCLRAVEYCIVIK